MKTWDKISKALGVLPVSSAVIGAAGLRVERFIFQLNQCEVPPIDAMVLACHLGGARATIGRKPGPTFDFIPGSSALFQPGYGSSWLFGGAIDLAIFYFVEPEMAA